MPPKKVICSICSEEVLKSKTKHIGDGKRACTAHDGVSEKSDALKEKDKQRRTKMKEAPKHRGFRSLEDIPTSPECFVCGSSGMHLKEFFFELYKASAVLQKEGMMPDPFNPSTYSEYFMRKYGKVPVRLIATTKEKIAKHKDIRIKNKYRDTFNMIGLVLICTDCAEKHEAKDLYPEPPKIESLDNLMTLGAVAEVVMEPVIEEEAEKFRKFKYQ